MDLPVIIFVLLFFLVIILILLHTSNKKYADKISILEQTLDMKVDALTSLKETYEESRRVIDKHASQASEIEDKKNTIIHLEADKVSLGVTIDEKNIEIDAEHKKYDANVQENIDNIAKLNSEAKAQALVISGLKKTHQKEMKCVDEEKLGLEDTIRIKNNENQELSSLLTKTVQDYDSNITLLKQEITEQKNTEKALISDYVTVQKEFEKNKEIIEENKISYEEHIKTLEINVASKKQLILKLEQQSKQTIENYDKDILLLKQEINTQDIKTKALESEYTLLTKEYELKHIENKKIIQSKMETITTLEKDNSNYLIKIEKLNEDIELNKQMIFEHNNEIKKLLESVAILKKQILEKEESINTSSKEYQKRIQNVNLDKKKLESTIIAQEQTIAALSKSFDTIKVKNEEELSNLHIELNQKEKALQELKHEHITMLDKSHKNILLSEQDIVKLNHQNQNAIQRLNKEKSILEEQVSMYNSEVNNIKKKYNTLYEKFTRLEKSLNIKEDIISELHTEKEKLAPIATPDEVLKAIQFGASKSDVSKKFAIPVKQIDLILKFDLLHKKRQLKSKE